MSNNKKKDESEEESSESSGSEEQETIPVATNAKPAQTALKEPPAPKKDESSGDSDKDDSDEDSEDEKPTKKKPAKKTAPKRKAPTKRKKKKDPNAPKRTLTSYMCYMKEKRKDYADKYPKLSFGDLSKRIAEVWKKLSPEEKAPYEEMHAKDKLRYDEEMKNYTKPESDSESESEEEEKKKPRKKAKRDPDAPKKASNAYLYYTKENREKVKKEMHAKDPAIKLTDVTKELGARWKSLTPVEKAPYDKLAKEDKARYDKEKEEYENK